MLAYKFLDAEGRAPFTGTWWEPGVWVEADTALPCAEGVHACEARHLSYWLSASLWEVELDGQIATAEHKLAASRGRLIREIEGYRSVLAELAVERIWHWRDAVVVADTTDALAAASTLDDLAGLPPIDDTTPRGRVSALVADAAKHAVDRNPATALFILACCAGFMAVDDNDDDDQGGFDRGFAAERALHSGWLTDRLALA